MEPCRALPPPDRGERIEQYEPSRAGIWTPGPAASTAAELPGSETSRILGLVFPLFVFVVAVTLGHGGRGLLLFLLLVAARGDVRAARGTSKRGHGDGERDRGREGRA